MDTTDSAESNPLAERVSELNRAEEAQRQRAEAMATAARQQAAIDPIDRLPASAKSKEWLKAHRDVLDDPVRYLRLQGAHFNALADGVVADSQPYFARLESAIAHHPASHTQEPATMPNYPAPPRRPIVSAPVSRRGGASVGSGPGSHSGRIHLTAEQREWARNSRITDLEYGKQLQRLAEEKKRGNYPSGER